MGCNLGHFWLCLGCDLGRFVFYFDSVCVLFCSVCGHFGLFLCHFGLGYGSFLVVISVLLSCVLGHFVF